MNKQGDEAGHCNKVIIQYIVDFTANETWNIGNSSENKQAGYKDYNIHCY